MKSKTHIDGRSRTLLPVGMERGARRSRRFSTASRRNHRSFGGVRGVDPKNGVALRCVRSAGFPACGFWRLSSRQFPHGNTGLESPVNPQTGMSALPPLASIAPQATSAFEFRVARRFAACATAPRLLSIGLRTARRAPAGETGSHFQLSAGGDFRDRSGSVAKNSDKTNLTRCEIFRGKVPPRKTQK